MSSTILPDITVLLLTKDEAGNISDLIREISEVITSLNLTHETIVVDGASSDDTWQKASAAGAQCIMQKRVGYGGALREGFMRAKAKYVLTLDSDWSHHPSLIKDIWSARDKADVVVASRFVPGGYSEAPALRRILSVVLNRVFMKLLKIPINDSSSGFRLYKRRVLKPDNYKSENFDILQEILVKAYADGFSVAEIPLHYHSRVAGKSHAQIIKFGISYLGTLYRMWSLRNSVDSADYDYRAYFSRIPLQRYWQRKRYSLINGYLRKGGRVLDVGCGSSKIIQDHPEAIAFDLAFRKLRYIRRTNRLLINGSTFCLPFKDGVFDQVVHSQVIEHIPLDPVIYQEINRVMKVGGNLIIGTPDYGRIWWPIIEYFYGKLLPNAYADEHITHYTRASLIEILANHGFRTEHWSYICGGELIVQATKLEAAGPI